MTERIASKALKPWTGIEKKFQIDLSRVVTDNDTGNQMYHNKIEASLREEEYDYIMEFLKERGVI